MGEQEYTSGDLRLHRYDDMAELFIERDGRHFYLLVPWRNLLTACYMALEQVDVDALEEAKQRDDTERHEVAK